MIGGMWLGSGFDAHADVPVTQRPDASEQRQIRDLQEEIERMKLLNQALWELLKERAKMTDSELQAKAAEIDSRDGVEDGRMTQNAPLRCPNCNRVSSARHWRCLYCGLEFEKPAMG